MTRVKGLDTCQTPRASTRTSRTPSERERRRGAQAARLFLLLLERCARETLLDGPAAGSDGPASEASGPASDPPRAERLQQASPRATACSPRAGGHAAADAGGHAAVDASET